MEIYSKIVPNKIIHKWYLFDATNKVLGRLATELVYVLRGKHKINYLPYLDQGDYCVVVNARKIYVTGHKSIDKKYYHHTGYPGGIKMVSFSDMLKNFPERIVEIAVKGMLPKGPLGRTIYRKLRVYPDCIHPHVAQKPIVLKDGLIYN